MYKAMVAGPSLNGISVHLSKLENPTPQTNYPKIDGIRSLYDFQYFLNGDIKAWRYFGILSFIKII